MIKKSLILLITLPFLLPYSFLSSQDVKDSSKRIITVNRQNVPLIHITFLSQLGASYVDQYGGEQELIASILSRSPLIKKLEQEGATGYFSSQFNAFTLSTSVLKEKLFSVLDSFFEEIQSFMITEADLQLAKKEMISFIEERESSPERTSLSSYYALLFKNHPYSKQQYSKSKINQISLKEIQNIYQAIFAKPFFRLLLVGDLKGINEKKLKPYLEKMKESNFKPLSVSSDRDLIRRKDEKKTITMKDVTQSFVNIGFLTPGDDPNTSYYYEILKEVLGGGFSSRLFKELRVKRGLTYSPHAIYSAKKEMGSLTINYSTKNSSIMESISIVNDILSDIKSNGITQDELETAQKILLTQLSSIEETNQSISKALVSDIEKNRPLFTYKVIMQKIKVIRLKDFNIFTTQNLKRAQFAQLVLRA